METPSMCHYCEQPFQDGDIVHVNFRQRQGRVQDVLHSVIDDLVEGAMNACREIAFLNGGKKRLGGLLGVYYGGQLYGFEGLEGEAQFEMSEGGTHHRMTNVQTLAFKLKPLGEQ